MNEKRSIVRKLRNLIATMEDQIGTLGVMMIEGLTTNINMMDVLINEIITDVKITIGTDLELAMTKMIINMLTGKRGIVLVQEEMNSDTLIIGIPKQEILGYEIKRTKALVEETRPLKMSSFTIEGREEKMDPVEIHG